MLEGSTLTAIRTGAASGAATDLLARPDSQVVAIFGAGVQGRTQLEAVCTVRPIRTGWVFDSDRHRAEDFVHEMAGRHPIPADLRIAESPTMAVDRGGGDLHRHHLRDAGLLRQGFKTGVHINAVGAYTPGCRKSRRRQSGAPGWWSIRVLPA